MREYSSIQFLMSARRPGGMPSAYDTGKGGSITCEDGVVTLRNHEGRVWEAPWSSVAWAVPGKAKVAAFPVQEQTSYVRHGRVKQPNLGEIQREALARGDDQLAAEGKPADPAPSSDGWKPPKKPSAKKLQRQKSEVET